MATKWNLDPTHSEITFKVRHMMISNVKGAFNSFSAEIEAEDDSFKNAKVSATINTDSIDTNNADRDAHLKSADFLMQKQTQPLLLKARLLLMKSQEILP
jgi:polyisoprenoid-binding protein YceI